MLLKVSLFLIFAVLMCNVAVNKPMNCGFAH